MNSAFLTSPDRFSKEGLTVWEFSPDRLYNVEFHVSEFFTSCFRIPSSWVVQCRIPCFRIPPRRWPDEFYVFVISESPATVWWPANTASKFNGFFNLSMTYRHDSDIRYNQIVIERRNHSNAHDKVNVRVFHECYYCQLHFSCGIRN